MKYYLIDDLGRLVGVTDCQRGIVGVVEYGRRDDNGILHVAGRARLIAPSRLTLSHVENLSAGIVPGYRDI